MDSVGEGEGGEIWENSIETCIISCMKRVASPGSMHGTGCLGLVHWDDPEGGEGREEGGGRRVQDGESLWVPAHLQATRGRCGCFTQRRAALLSGPGLEGGGHA